MRVPKTFLAAAALVVLGLLVAAATIVPASPALTTASAFRSGVQVAPQREGDALRYERAWSDDGEAFRAELLVEVGGRSTAVDAYGVTREVDEMSVSIRGPASDSDYACAFLRGGPDLVRRDLLAGKDVTSMSGRWDNIPLTESSTRQATQTLALATAFDAHCSGRHALGGRTLEEGDALTLREALGGAVRMLEDARATAVATTWEGRDAMRFTFELEEGRVIATWADGLAGIARLEVQGAPLRFERTVLDGDLDAPFVMTLIGHARGEGDVLGDEGAALPERHPTATFVPFPPLTVDDEAFAPPYRFADAIAALRADPLTCASQLLVRPDVIVTRAEWDAEARDPLAHDVPTQGGWSVWLVSGEDTCDAFTVRVRPHPMLPPTDRNYGDDGPLPMIGVGEAAPQLPAESMSPADLGEALARAGVDPASAASATWTLTRRDGEPSLHLRVVQSSANPREASFDVSAAADLLPVKGSVLAVMVAETEVIETTVPLGSRAATLPTFEAASLGGLGGPGIGEGLVVAGAATALVLLGKFLLLPLYSRLRRATLLDNPVRARLYDAVRRDPGVHRAALIEFAGVGAGATTRHLRQLVAHRYVVEVRAGGFARYFAAGEVPPDVARREGSLRAGSRRQVYELYRAEPALSLREAAARLGMSAPSVHRAKRQLEQEGLLPAASEARVAEG